MFVLFIDIDGIVDHHCFNFHFIKILAKIVLPHS